MRNKEVVWRDDLNQEIEKEPENILTEE